MDIAQLRALPPNMIEPLHEDHKIFRTVNLFLTQSIFHLFQPL